MSAPPSDGETLRVPDPGADDPTLDTLDQRFDFVRGADLTGRELWIIDDGTPYQTGVVPKAAADSEAPDA